MRCWRANLILIFIFLFGAAIIGRLIFLQILQRGFWNALAQGQQKFIGEITGHRGEIFLEGENHTLLPLASNKKWSIIYVSPKEIEFPEETAEALAQALNPPPLEMGDNRTSKGRRDLILAKFKKDTFYELIKEKLTEQEVQNLKDLNLAGIYLKEQTFRYYPRETFAAHVIGFLGGENIGQYGIEGYYDQVLQGRKRFVEDEKIPGGYLFSAKRRDWAKRGLDIVLTLDYNVQFMAEKLLEKAHATLGIKEGQIIVIDPRTGKIFALVHFPSFDPNQYSKAKSLDIFQNGAIQKIFEPGSVFKPITMAAALEEEKITPQTTYYDKGKIKIGGYTIYNYDGRVWGERTMIEVLEKSINTGAIFAERQIGHELFLKYLERFGIFEPTGIDLQGEIFSDNKNLRKGREINFATASFGQGVEITPIGLVRAFCAIANGGKLIRPYLVQKIIKGKEIIERQPEIQRDSVISPRTASQLTAMMVSVVKNGFAKAADIDGYYIAGKTGTAQVPFEEKPGYWPDRTIQSFVGFAPAFDPQFLILIKLNNPKAKTAEYSAAPLFHDLAKYIIDYWEIPPDYE